MPQFITLLLSLTLLLLVAIETPVHASKKVEIKRVDISAEMLRDGSMKIVEKRTLHFYGYSSGATIYFYTAGGIGYSDILVRDIAVDYNKVTTMPTTVPGTYSTRHYRDKVVIDWSFKANNETRIFFIEYNVNNAVTVHQDVAELFHIFIGDEWDIPTQQAAVTLKLPPGIGPVETKAWGHGPLHGTVDIEDPRKITWTVSPLPAGQGLGGRVTFPTILVPAATRRSNVESLPRILREEEFYSRLSNLTRLPLFSYRMLQKMVREYEASIALLLIIPYGLYYINLRNRSYRKKESFSGNYYRELPGDYPPEIAGYLWSKGNPRSNFLAAGILNLAHKGFIKISEAEPSPGLKQNAANSKGSYRLIKNKSDQQKNRFEEIICDFFFNTIADHYYSKEAEGKNSADNREIMLTDINAFARIAPKEYEAFYSSWLNAFSEEGEKHKFFEPLAIEKLNYLDYLVYFVSAFLTLAALFTWDMIFIFSMLSVILGILSIITPRVWLTSFGGDQLAKWKAFRQYLLHFSRIEDASLPSLVIWEKYLVYAVALGFAEETAKQLNTNKLSFTKAKAELEREKQETSFLMAEDLFNLLSNADRLSYSFSKTFFAADTNMRTAGQGQTTQALNSSRIIFSSGSGEGGGFSGGGGGGGGASGGGGGSFR